MNQMAAPRHEALRQALLALGLITVFAALAWVLAQWAGTPRSWISLWALTAVGGEALMVLAIARGWVARLPDPSLTLPQIAFTMTMTAVVYPLMGDWRSAVLPVYLLILSFAMFQLRSATTFFALAAFTLAMVAAAMVVGLLLQPGRVDPRGELVHFFVMLLTVTGVSILAQRMAAIRMRLQRQRVELGHALARIEELAIRDGLTGLFNRRHGEELLRQAIARAQRDGSPLQVLLIDLDHFKSINDSRGHAAGDAVLRGFAQLACDALRATDTLMRWGGEEFLLLLPGDEGDASIERLQLSVAAAALRLESGDPQRLAFSGGLTRVGADDRAETVLARADAALYRAKSLGRNRVERG